MFTSGDFRYRILPDNTLRITGYRGHSEEVTVPAELDGIPVSQVGNGVFHHQRQLVRVTLEEGIRRAGWDLFGYCDRLREIRFPRSLLILEGGAMQGCFSLEEVVLPPDLTTLPPVCFGGCRALKRVTLPPRLRLIRHEAFDGCRSLEQLELPGTLTGIGSRAFADCTSLQTLFLPAGLESIGDRAFPGTAGFLAEVVLDSPAYRYCNEHGQRFALREKPQPAPVLTDEEIKRILGIPTGADRDSVAEEDARADWVWERDGDELTLTGCLKQDKEVQVPARIGGLPVTRLGEALFKKAGLTRLTLPEGLREIGDDACSSCVSLESVALPASLRHIGKGAFLGCKSLREISLPEGLESIGDGAFTLCLSLRDLTIPSSVTRIGAVAFVTMGPLGLRVYPGSEAERYCRQNKLRYEPAGAPGRLGTCGGFAVTELRDGGLRIRRYKGTEEQLMIPAVLGGRQVTEIGNAAFCLNRQLTWAMIPQGVTRLGTEAFGFCRALTDVSIPASVVSIGGQCFLGCRALTSVDLPEGVMRLGRDAFGGCRALTDVYLPDSLVYLGKDAFGGCPALTVHVHPGSRAADFCRAGGIRFVVE